MLLQNSTGGVYLIGLCLGLLYHSGGWLLAGRDPAAVDEERGLSARRMIRITAIVWLASYFVGFPRQIVSPFGKQLPALCLMFVFSGFVAVGQFVRLRYLGRLAERMPECGQARRARLLSWLYGGSALATWALSWGLPLVAFVVGMGLWQGRLMSAWFVLIAAHSVLSIIYLVFLSRMSAGLRHALASRPSSPAPIP
jgi:hypothetical protein